MTTRFQAMSADNGSRKKTFLVSVAIHVVRLGVFPFLLTSFGSNEPEKIEIVFYKPPPEWPAPAALPEPEPRPEPEAEPAPEPAPKPQPPEPKPEPPKPRPKPVPQPKPVVAQVQPRPRSKTAAPPPPEPKPRPVRTNVFAEARAETVAVTTPERKTRSAGFSRPETDPVPAPRRSNHRAAARVGNFEVDTQASDDASPPERDRVVTTSTFADNRVREAPRETRRPAGTVETTSFTVELGSPVVLTLT